MLLNMVMFKVTICDFRKMNINMTDKIEKKEATFAVPYNGEDIPSRNPLPLAKPTQSFPSVPAN